MLFKEVDQILEQIMSSMQYVCTLCCVKEPEWVHTQTVHIFNQVKKMVYSFSVWFLNRIIRLFQAKAGVFSSEAIIIHFQPRGSVLQAHKGFFARQQEQHMYLLGQPLLV